MRSIHLLVCYSFLYISMSNVSGEHAGGSPLSSSPTDVDAFRASVSAMDSAFAGPMRSSYLDRLTLTCTPAIAGCSSPGILALPVGNVVIDSENEHQRQPPSCNSVITLLTNLRSAAGSALTANDVPGNGWTLSTNSFAHSS